MATGEEKKLEFFLVLYYRHYTIIIIINHNLLQIISKIQSNYIKINYIKRLPSIQLYMQNTKKNSEMLNVWNNPKCMEQRKYIRYIYKTRTSETNLI